VLRSGNRGVTPDFRPHDSRVLGRGDDGGDVHRSVGQRPLTLATSGSQRWPQEPATNGCVKDSFVSIVLTGMITTTIVPMLLVAPH
jgi:hypothetical protein